MTVHNDDILGLYSPEIATYEDLALMLETSTLEENADGSVLAASLLQLPDVFTQSTASAILDSVEFNIHSSERELGDNGEFLPASEILAKRFRRLDEISKEEKTLDPVDTSILEQVVDFAEEDVEAARDFFQATNDMRHTDQRELSPMEKIRLLRDELEADSAEVTTGQLMLVEDRNTAAVAERYFPAAEKLLSALSEQEMTPAEERREERRQRAERERYSAAGNRQTAESSDFEIMLLLDEDPELVASVALNSVAITREQLLDSLAKASDLMIANWILGLERQQPQRGEIEKLMTNFNDDRIREIAASCQQELKKYDENDVDLPSIPWVVDVIQHVYVPRMYLDAPTAELVRHELAKICGDDPALWLAVLLSDTTDTPTRIQDIV